MPPSGSLISAERHVSASLARFAESVRDGLTHPAQKRLSPEYLYDELGSALFEAITVVPEYGLTRADRRILCRHSDQIARSTPLPVSVLELGSGSGTKTAHVLRSISRRQGAVSYYPIDVSRSALEHCQRELSGEAQVHPIEATFVEGVRTALAGIPRDHTALLLFLGSTIGNFDRPAASELLSQLRSTLGEGDLMLIGADLVKPVETLIRAYDDPAGVTSAFNLNLLARINRELGADFDLRQFRHQARYDAKLQRIEMHLVARGSQRVAIPAADCDVHFAAGESIWTEASCKYDLPELDAMAQSGGFRVLEAWTDREWPFAESLWQAV